VEHWHANIEADVLMTSLALLTSAATVIEGNSDSISFFETGYVRAHLFHNAAELMTEDDRRSGRDAEPRPTSLPEVVIRETDAIGLDFDNGVIGTAIGVRPVRVNNKGLRNFFNNSSFHLESP
jgi:hypothetical protein